MQVVSQMILYKVNSANITILPEEVQEALRDYVNCWLLEELMEKISVKTSLLFKL